MDFDMSMSNSMTPEEAARRSEYKYNLIKKIKKEKRIIKNQLENEKKEFIELKKNAKITKANELQIENEILNEQFNKISSLLSNSLNVINRNERKIKDKSTLEETMNHQIVIINSLKKDIKNNEIMEKEKKDELELHKQRLEATLKKITKVNEENDQLKKRNDLLNNEKKKFVKITKYNSLDTYEIKITKLQSQLAHYKSQAKRSEKIVQNLQETHDKLHKQNQELTKNTIHLSSSSLKVIKTSPQMNNDEEEIARLKKILEENKQKENELEQQVYQYQEKISNLSQSIEMNNNINFGLNENNPFFTSDEKNEPIKSRLLTNEQITEFTYVLYKNFEARKIFKEEAKTLIIDKIFDANSSSLSLDTLMNNFSSTISQLLHCENENDKILSSLFFGALCCNYEGNAVKIINSFLSLFTYLTKYDTEIENKFKGKISTKYKTNFLSLQSSINSYLSTSESKRDYISLLEIKKILDNNPVINIKDKYIEFLFYYMKQFDDPSASLYDLKLSKLNELIPEGENEEIVNESVQEISPESYFKEINTSLASLKEICDKEKKKLGELVKESVVKINKKPFNVINVESFHEEIAKRGTILSELQLSCLYNKYCCNEDLKAMDIGEIEADVDKYGIKEGNEVIEEEDDLNGARYYDNDENLENSDGDEEKEDEKIKSKLNHSL